MISKSENLDFFSIQTVIQITQNLMAYKLDPCFDFFQKDPIEP